MVADVGMPGQSIIEFIKNLKALHPGVPVLILLTHDESIHAERLIRAGAHGYIMKSEGGANLLLKAIREVLQRQPYLSAAMSAKPFETFGGRRARGEELMRDRLTDREGTEPQPEDRGGASAEPLPQAGSQIGSQAGALIKQTFRFRAPGATSVLLVGDFTGWQKQPLPLHKQGADLWGVEVDPGYCPAWFPMLPSTRGFCRSRTF